MRSRVKSCSPGVSKPRPQEPGGLGVAVARPRPHPCKCRPHTRRRGTGCEIRGTVHHAPLPGQVHGAEWGCRVPRTVADGHVGTSSFPWEVAISVLVQWRCGGGVGPQKPPPFLPHQASTGPARHQSACRTGAGGGCALAGRAWGLRLRWEYGAAGHRAPGLAHPGRLEARRQAAQLRLPPNSKGRPRPLGV